MQPIHSDQAPAALGPYSQAIRVDRLLFLSGQIGLDPEHQTLVAGGVEAEARQVFRNLAAVAEAAGGSLPQTVKLTLYLTDLSAFPLVNAIMADVFSEPFPARATVGVAALPRGAMIEADAILWLDGPGGG